VVNLKIMRPKKVDASLTMTSKINIQVGIFKLESDLRLQW
jgi:hypothetical protein